MKEPLPHQSTEFHPSDKRDQQQQIDRYTSGNQTFRYPMIHIDVTKTLNKVDLSYKFTGASYRVVLFGPSGSGKTLLLKMIAGFFEPDYGRIAINGKAIFDSQQNIHIPIHQRDIGYLPQEYTLFPNMTVRENIQYGLKIKAMRPEDSIFTKLVQRLEIDPLLDKHPAKLSGGQQQRVALARALVVKPQTLLLDEPFSALDSSIRESLRDLVIDITDEMKINALFVTHDLEEAYIFGQEIVLVHQGRVVESGDRQHLLGSPQYVETARLIGFENIWPVKRIGENRSQTLSGLTFSHQTSFPEEAKHLCIRPENIIFLKEDKPYKASLKQNVVSGKIVSLHDRGKYINVSFLTDEGLKLVINVPEHAFLRLKLEKNKVCKVSLKEESIVLCR